MPPPGRPKKFKNCENNFQNFVKKKIIFCTRNTINGISKYFVESLNEIPQTKKRQVYVKS